MNLFVIHECSWAIIASKFKDKTTRQCRRRLVRLTMIYMVLLMSSSSIGIFSLYKRKKQWYGPLFCPVFFVLMLFCLILYGWQWCRWYTYLNSDFKKGGWSPEEDLLLCEVIDAVQRIFFSFFFLIFKIFFKGL